MNEIQLFSLRRTIIISLILGLFTMVMVGQALNAGTPNDGNIDDQVSSSTTSATETSTTTTTSTQMDSQTSTQTDFSGVTETFTQTETANIRDQEINMDEAADIESDSLSGFSNSFSNIFSFSFQFLLTSALFFSMIAIFYIFVFNNSELKNYINQSLTQAGFQGKISSIGKQWVIKGKYRDFSMNIKGLRNLRMKIELPKNIDTDPREFGLRRLSKSAITYCDLELLPMRLQVVKMYLTELG